MKATILSTITILAVIAGCSRSSSSTSTGAHPNVSEFSIGDAKIGDPLTEEFKSTHKWTGSAHTFDEIRTGEIDVTGGKIEVSYHFIGNTLSAITLTFPAELFDEMVSVYSEKLGSPSVQNLGWVKWPTASGDFYLKREPSTGIGGIYSKRYEDALAKESHSVRDELKKGL